MQSYLAIYYPNHTSPGSEQVLREVSRGAYEEAVANKCPYYIQHVRDLQGAGQSLGLMGMAGGERLAQQWRALGIPMVNFSNGKGPVPGMANVLSDDEAVGRLAAAHLREKGFHHFLAVGEKGMNWSRERLRGFIAPLQKRGHLIEAVDVDMQDNRNVRTPEAYMRAIWDQVAPHLHRCPLATGVFAANDWLAWPLLRQMEEKNPERLHTTGVLGVDNLHDQLFDPRRTAGLSSILPGFHRVGALGLEWLVEAVRDGKSIEDRLARIPPARLFARGSTSGQACGDPVVSKVMRELWAGLRMREEIPIAELARANGMSLRNMELRFEEHLGQSARSLMADMRIQLGKELLRDTAEPIAVISKRCGYANTTTFSTLFRKKVGCSPRQWRSPQS